MARTLIYTITTGRSGTGYLAELLRANLPDADVFHERAGWLDLGVNAPDASHHTRFNTLGNVPEVRAFWAQKLGRDIRSARSVYAETSHMNGKAGLVENLDLLPEDVKVELIALRRDPFQIVWSYHNRFEFTNFGYTWLFSLDPRYRNVISKVEPLRKFGALGTAIWYVIEMQTRAEYYKHLTAEMPNVTIHDVTLGDISEATGAAAVLSALTGETHPKVDVPGPANTTQTWFFGEKVREQIRGVVEAVNWDPAELAAAYWNAGRRLADGPMGPSVAPPSGDPL